MLVRGCSTLQDHGSASKCDTLLEMHTKIVWRMAFVPKDDRQLTVRACIASCEAGERGSAKHQPNLGVQNCLIPDTPSPVKPNAAARQDLIRGAASCATMGLFSRMTGSSHTSSGGNIYHCGRPNALHSNPTDLPAVDPAAFARCARPVGRLRALVHRVLSTTVLAHTACRRPSRPSTARRRVSASLSARRATAASATAVSVRRRGASTIPTAATARLWPGADRFAESLARSCMPYARHTWRARLCPNMCTHQLRVGTHPQSPTSTLVQPYHALEKRQSSLRQPCPEESLTRTDGGAFAAGGAMPVTPGTGPGSDFLPLLRQNLTKLVATNSLQAFYPPQRIEEVLARLVQVDFRC